MKKAILLILIFLLIFNIFGCSKNTTTNQTADPNNTSENIVEIKLAVATTGENPLAIYGRQVKSAIEEKSSGKMKVTVYDNSSLGAERDMSEGVQMGTIEMMTVIPEAAFASFVPEMQVLALPFAIEDREHAFRILDNEEFLGHIKPLYEEANYKLLGFSELGFRQTTNSKRRVESADDMKGLVMRVMESPIWYKTAEGLGISPTAIAFNELYTSLQQGVIDGQDNPIVTIATSKFYEIQDYLLLNNQTFGTTSCVANLEFYNNLSDQQQKIIDEACHEATLKTRGIVADNESKFIEELYKSGIDIVSDPDMESFKEATAHIYVDPQTIETIGQKLIDIFLSIE